MIAESFLNKRIGIIGGMGGMGRWFTAFFKERGFLVKVSDLDTELDNKKLVELSDIIILSTPMAIALDLAEELGPLLSSDQLFIDFSSFKEEVLSFMLKHSSAEVLGIHPMFGQHTTSMQGQNLILTPARGDTCTKDLYDLFAEAGARVSIMDAALHDRYMAFVQSLTHLISIATAAYIKKENLDLDILRSAATLIFRLNLGCVGRLFALDLSLYEDLISRNPYAREVSEDFFEVLKESADILLSEDNKDKRSWMEGLRDFLGPFCKEALLESNQLLAVFSDKK